MNNEFVSDVSEIGMNTIKIGLQFIKNINNASMLFSPLSLSSILYMLYIGSTGKTKNQLNNYLGLSVSKKIMREFLDINKDFRQENIIENYICVKNDLEINKKYKMVVSQLANIHNVYFDDDFIKNINKSIDRKTHGLIKNFVKNIDSDCVMFLLNIIYFNEKWKYQFDKNLTKENIFYSYDTKSKVKFMNVKNKFNFSENYQYQLLEMPYKNNLFTMGFILPKHILNKFEIFNSTEFIQLIGDMRTCKVDVFIPKFEQSVNIELNKILQKFGVVSMFDNLCVDFENISKTCNGENLYVSRIVQRAVIKVNEDGTEASAVTASYISANCVDIETDKTKVFNANHPFMYYIRHIKTNSIIFIGKYI